MIAFREKRDTMNRRHLISTSFFFTGSWARFMGAGFFALEKNRDEIDECG